MCTPRGRGGRRAPRGGRCGPRAPPAPAAIPDASGESVVMHLVHASCFMDDILCMSYHFTLLCLSCHFNGFDFTFWVFMFLMFGVVCFMFHALGFRVTLGVCFMSDG